MVDAVGAQVVVNPSAAALDSRRLLLVLAGIFALALAAGGAILWLWP